MVLYSIQNAHQITLFKMQFRLSLTTRKSTTGLISVKCTERKQGKALSYDWPIYEKEEKIVWVKKKRSSLSVKLYC